MNNELLELIEQLNEDILVVDKLNKIILLQYKRISFLLGINKKDNIMNDERYLELIYKLNNGEINVFKDYKERLAFYKRLYKDKDTYC